MNSTGWRPRRTLVFCNWDAEEHGLAGSTEFVKEFAAQLHDRAVTYLNLDLLSNNQTLDVRAVPTLYQTVVNAARLVPSPLAPNETVYDTWLRHFPSDTPWLPDYPHMKVPGGGSDHYHFLNYIGLPVLDFTYRNASWANPLSYPLYHTLYETPFVNEHLFDREEFAVHKASGQFWAQLALSFTEPDIFPLNVSILARRLQLDYVEGLRQAIEPLMGDELEPAKQQLSFLLEKSLEFVSSAERFEREHILPLSTRDANEGKMSPGQVNRRLKAVDRCFIVARGTSVSPDMPLKRHTLFSLHGSDGYQSAVMASVYRQLDNFRRATGKKEKRNYGRQVAREIATVQMGVQCAINEMQWFV